ncbi:MAG: phosphate ABC transporter substrate-binding protein [bacterium]|nr:phosphate ABC transporter substrate-binding protein [bacterium]
MGVFIKDAAKVYRHVTFTINTEPESGGGEAAAVYGKTDIGGVAREIHEDIIKKGVKKFLIGKDAIGVWVHAGNPVKSLTKDQLKRIFTGKISNWKEVGGKDLPVNIYIVNPQSATRKVFRQSILGKETYVGNNIVTMRPDPALLDKIASDPNGIGQLSFALSVGHPSLGGVKRINIGNQVASVNNADYPITRPLYFVTKGEPEGSVKAFIDWTLSDKGQAIIKKYFVGIR